MTDDLIGKLSRQDSQLRPSHSTSFPETDAWSEPLPLPDQLLPVAPFDNALLPQSLQRWVADIAERLQVPGEFVAVPAMICLAGVVGRKVGIRPARRDDWCSIPNLWGAIIGRPGLMKTPSLKEPLGVLQRLEAEARSVYSQAMRNHEEKLLLAEATVKVRKDDLRKAVRKGSGAEEIAAQIREAQPVEPTQRRLIVSDSTVEKLGELLAENPNGLVAFRDELTGLLRSLEKKGQDNARSFYLECWNGNGSTSVDRIGRGSFPVPCAILSMIGGIQPAPLIAYLREQTGAGDDGLMQRLQLAVWPDTPTTWKHIDREPDRDARAAAFAVYERLHNLQPVTLAAEREEQEHVPFLHFDEVAQEKFDAWRHELEPRLLCKDEHPAMLAHLAKYRSLIPSLALLIHLADEPDGGAVTLAPLEKAIAWAEYLETHARRLYASITQPATDSARRIASKIRTGKLGDGFTARDVYRRRWSGLVGPADVRPGLDLLVDLGWLRACKLETGGAPRMVYLINPTILQSAREAA